MIKAIAILLIAIVIGVSGVKLARYAEVDDSPGGVVIGWVMVIGAVGLGLMGLQRLSASKNQRAN